MRQISKIVEIPATTTANQIETALNNHLDKGWHLVSVFSLGTKTFAVLIKVVAT